MTDLLRLGLFLAFLALGARVALSRAQSTRRRRINEFLVFVLAASWAVGLAQRDAWPFSPYPLMRGLWDASFTYTKVAFFGLDAEGREWEIDPYAWSPVFPLVLQEWFKESYPRLPPEGKERVARFLLDRAEEARARRARGGRIGPERILGPLAATDWWLYKPVTDICPTPYVGLRVYHDWWTPDRRMLDAKQVVRVVVLEHRRR